MEYVVSGKMPVVDVGVMEAACPLPAPRIPEYVGEDMRFDEREDRTYRADEFGFFSILARCMCS